MKRFYGELSDLLSSYSSMALKEAMAYAKSEGLSHSEGDDIVIIPPKVAKASIYALIAPFNFPIIDVIGKDYNAIITSFMNQFIGKGKMMCPEYNFEKNTKVYISSLSRAEDSAVYSFLRYKKDNNWKDLAFIYDGFFNYYGSHCFTYLDVISRLLYFNENLEKVLEAESEAKSGYNSELTDEIAFEILFRDGLLVYDKNSQTIFAYKEFSESDYCINGLWLSACILGAVKHVKRVVFTDSLKLN